MGLHNLIVRSARFPTYLIHSDVVADPTIRLCRPCGGGETEAGRFRVEMKNRDHTSVTRP